MNQQNNISEVTDGCQTSLIKYLNNNTILIGPRMCGKTMFIIHEIYQQIQEQINSLYVISSNESEYNKITDKINTVDDLPDILNDIKKKRELDKNHKSMVIIDCLIPDNIYIRELVINGRCMNVTLVMSEQYPMMTVAVRSNMDNVLLGHGYSMDVLKSLYEKYGGSVHSFSRFVELMYATPNYSFMCADNNVVLKATNIKNNQLLIKQSDLISTSVHTLLKINQMITELNYHIDGLIALRNQLKQMR